MINIKKMIIPTVAIAILSVAIATAEIRYSTQDLDGKYTLNRIIAQDGEVTNFAYGGELTVKDLKTTFNTSRQRYNW